MSKYIEINNAMRGVAIIKIKNIDMLSCHPPEHGGTPNSTDFMSSKFYHIKFQLKRGEPVVAFYKNEHEMNEEYLNIHNILMEKNNGMD